MSEFGLMKQLSTRLWVNRKFKRICGWLAVLFLGSVAYLLYLPSFSNWGVIDDLVHVRAAMNKVAPTLTLFRPLERFSNEVNVAWLGPNDLRFSLVVNFLGYLLTTAGTYVLGRHLFPRSVLPSLFACALVAFSPITAVATLQIDTISQQFATGFSVWFFLALSVATTKRSPPLYIAAFSSAMLALLSKETSLGMVACVPLATFLAGPTRRKPRANAPLHDVFRNYVALGLIFVGYLAARGASGYRFNGLPDDMYYITFNFEQIIENIAIYFAGLLYIGGSSFDIFPSLKPWRLVISAVFTFTLGSLSILGFIRPRFSRRMALLTLVLLFLAGAAPVLPVGTLSELYVYSSLPFFALFVAFSSYDGLRHLNQHLQRPVNEVLTATFCLLLLSWLAFGTHEKIAAYGRESLLTRRYALQTQPFVQSITQKHITLCWVPSEQDDIPSFGVFAIDPSVLAYYAIDHAAASNRQTMTMNRVGEIYEQPCSHRVQLVNSARDLVFTEVGGANSGL